MTILFDIGRTKTRIAYSENLESFETPEVFATSGNYEEGLKNIISAIENVSKGRVLGNIAGGITRAIGDSSYKNLKNDLLEKFGIEPNVVNDGALVGLGEANFGAGKGFDIVAYITVSTGVGGARIVGGKLDEASVGFEPGKQIIDIENDTSKTLEDLISGKALEEKTGRPPKETTDAKVWLEHARILAIGLNNLTVSWSPDIIVLGGSMITGDPAIPLDKTEEYLKDTLKIFPDIPIIKKAELGDFGGLYGGLAILKQQNGN